MCLPITTSIFVDWSPWVFVYVFSNLVPKWTEWSCWVFVNYQVRKSPFPPSQRFLMAHGIESVSNDQTQGHWYKRWRHHWTHLSPSTCGLKHLVETESPRHLAHGYRQILNDMSLGKEARTPKPSDHVFLFKKDREAMTLHWCEFQKGNKINCLYSTPILLIYTNTGQLN